MASFRCVGAIALSFAGSTAFRIARERSSGSLASKTKLIAGVPVLNYQNAYQTSLVGHQGGEEQEWVVVVKLGTTDAQMEVMCKTSKNACNLVGHANGGVPFFEMRGTEQDLEAVISAGGGAVKYVEPDHEVYMIPEMESEVEALTWGLNRIGTDQRGRTGAGTTIFVLDTGVRFTHQEFGGRASGALDMSTGDPAVCSGDQNCALDARGHGTHCAGSASGETYGVAPSAEVKAIKVLNNQGSGAWSWSYYALDWLAMSTVRPAIASMSLGGLGTETAMRDAVDAAVNAGVTVVVAAGNDNSDACGYSPAFAPSAITVGSTTSLDARSSFSNYGSCVNIWGPGSSVLSSHVTSDTATRTLSGTSMACPHVSGAAALVLSANPSMKSSAVLGELLNNAARNALADLKIGDTNALVYVGEGGAPPNPSPLPPSPAPTPNPSLPPTPVGNCKSWCTSADCEKYPSSCGLCPFCDGSAPSPPPLRRRSPPRRRAPTPPPTPAPGNCNGWCSDPADCTDYPNSCSGCSFCGGSPVPTPSSPTPSSPTPPVPSPPGNCLDICDRESDCTSYPSICGGCSFC